MYQSQPGGPGQPPPSMMDAIAQGLMVDKRDAERVIEESPNRRYAKVIASRSHPRNTNMTRNVVHKKMTTRY